MPDGALKAYQTATSVTIWPFRILRRPVAGRHSSQGPRGVRTLLAFSSRRAPHGPTAWKRTVGSPPAMATGLREGLQVHRQRQRSVTAARADASVRHARTA